MSNFTIDFFEFSFLVEACLPERPIARTIFFQEVIDKYYHEMTDEERTILFNWIQLNPQFDLSKEDCLWFYNRYNPNNQYLVKTKFEDKEEDVYAFEHKGFYATKRNTYILDEYIVSVEKINNND